MSILKKLVIFFIFFVLISCVQNRYGRDNTIEVFGSSKIEFVADCATVNIEIFNFSHDAYDVLLRTRNTNEILDNIFAELNIKNDNVLRSKIETTRKKNRDDEFIICQSKQFIQVYFKDLDSLELFLEKIIIYEDIFIEEIIYSHTNIESYENNAELIALNNAERKAQEMAREMNIKLDKISFILMQTYDNEKPSRLVYGSDLKWKQSIIKNVTIGYEIK